MSGERPGTVPPRAKAQVDPTGSSVVEDASEASTLYNKGYYGVPRSRGGLILDALETLYLVEAGRLDTAPSEKSGPRVSPKELTLMAHSQGRGFEIRYLVYRDLRQRGYVVKKGTGPVDFAVLPRGGTYPTTPSLYWVVAISERTPFSLSSLVEILETGHRAHKKILLGVVDEESDLTYYLARDVEPRGHRTPFSGSHGTHPAEGMFLEDRVAVFDAGAAAEFGGQEMFGSQVGERLELSLLEALYLSDQGRLDIVDGDAGKTLSRRTFLARAKAIESDLEKRLLVYASLRAAGLIPKTGFKYGTHFRAYEGDPGSTHAKYLLHAVSPAFVTSWPELSRAVRVAQGVRKSFLLAYAKDPTIHFVQIQRVRP